MGGAASRFCLLNEPRKKGARSAQARCSPKARLPYISAFNFRWWSPFLPSFFPLLTTFTSIPSLSLFSLSILFPPFLSTPFPFIHFFLFFSVPLSSNPFLLHTFLFQTFLFLPLLLSSSPVSLSACGRCLYRRSVCHCLWQICCTWWKKPDMITRTESCSTGSTGHVFISN